MGKRVDDEPSTRRPATAQPKLLMKTRCGDETSSSPCSRRADRSAFVGSRFSPEVIMLAVCWYLRFGLSYCDLEELLLERGVEVDHVALYRWVQRFTPLLGEAARPHLHTVGGRWFVDETDVKVAGKWR